MKKIIKAILKKFRIRIIRETKKSVKTTRLSFHETSTGNYWLPKDAYSDDIANTIKKNKIFEEPVYDVIKKYAKPNTEVIDIGSNFGQMAVLMSKLVGDNGLVHAFEANSFVYSILEKNCKENAKNIITYFGAVHDKSGESLFFQEQNFEEYNTYGAYGIDYINQNGHQVKTLTIDEIQFKKPVSFIKIDIQGGDLLAMKGAVETIKKNRCPIIFEYEYLLEEKLKLSFQEYVDFVKSIDYHFERVIIGQNFLILPNETKNK